MSLALIPDWQAQLRSRVYSGFYDTNWAVPLANALGIEGAQLDAAQIAMMSLLSIYPITNDPASAAYGIGRGVPLDRIGGNRRRAARLVGRCDLSDLDSGEDPRE